MFLSLRTAPTPTPRPAPGDPVGAFGAWVLGLPARLWHLAQTAAWPWLALVVLAVAVLALAARVVHAALWRRAVAAGIWVRITPPRTVATDAGTVWRLLASLARRARGGWRLAKPPLSLEIYQRGGRLRLGLWLPARIPLPVVAAEVARVWPGAAVTQADPPALAAKEWAVAGYRLMSTVDDTGLLVDDIHLTHRRARNTEDDPLAAVLAALREPHGPALMQVLVRPATSRRVMRLRDAARRPIPARRGGAALVTDGLLALLRGTIRLVLDVVTELVSTGTRPHRPAPRHGGRDGYEPPDALQRERMRDAAAKLRGGPHLLTTIRVAVARPDRGWARVDARHVGDGYAAASGVLRPVRFARAARVLAQRRAGRSHWLLVTPAELGVLAHLPADPARYGFDTAALHRAYPGGTENPAPERPHRTGPGWAWEGWTAPPTDDNDPTHDDPYDHDPYDDGLPDEGWAA